MADAVEERKRAEAMPEGPGKEAALKAALEREEKARAAVSELAVKEMADAVEERKRAEAMPEGPGKEAALKAALERLEKARAAVSESAGTTCTTRPGRTNSLKDYVLGSSEMEQAKSAVEELSDEDLLLYQDPIPAPAPRPKSWGCGFCGLFGGGADADE